MEIPGGRNRGGEEVKMSGSCWILIPILMALAVVLQRVDCFTRRNKVFDFNLVSPLPNYPHGALSEDGFYRVETNGTVLWFHVVLYYIRCIGCADCGGSSHCGTACSALVSENVRGYDVCNAIGHVSKTGVDVIDKENPGEGIVVKMSNGSEEKNCSLSVSVICQTNTVDGPIKLEKSGTCHYVIPNLDFWMTIPRRTLSLFASVVQRFRGTSYGHRSSYSPVNF